MCHPIVRVPPRFLQNGPKNNVETSARTCYKDVHSWSVDCVPHNSRPGGIAMPVSADQNTPGELPTPVLARSPDPVVARSPDRATDGIPDERPPVLARSPDRATDEQPTAEAQPDVAWSGDHATTDHATTDHATTDHATTDHATTDHATTDRATTEPAESPSDEKTPRGRRTILTPEKRRTILALLANGSSRRIAAQYADCSPSTIYRAVAARSRVRRRGGHGRK